MLQDLAILSPNGCSIRCLNGLRIRPIRQLKEQTQSLDQNILRRHNQFRRSRGNPAHRMLRRAHRYKGHRVHANFLPMVTTTFLVYSKCRLVRECLGRESRVVQKSFKGAALRGRAPVYQFSVKKNEGAAKLHAAFVIVWNGKNETL